MQVHVIPVSTNAILHKYDSITFCLSLWVFGKDRSFIIHALYLTPYELRHFSSIRGFSTYWVVDPVLKMFIISLYYQSLILYIIAVLKCSSGDSVVTFQRWPAINRLVLEMLVGNHCKKTCFDFIKLIIIKTAMLHTWYTSNLSTTRYQLFRHHSTAGALSLADRSFFSAVSTVLMITFYYFLL